MIVFDYRLRISPFWPLSPIRYGNNVRIIFACLTATFSSYDLLQFRRWSRLWRTSRVTESRIPSIKPEYSSDMSTCVYFGFILDDKIAETGFFRNCFTQQMIALSWTLRESRSCTHMTKKCKIKMELINSKTFTFMWTIQTSCSVAHRFRANSE